MSDQQYSQGHLDAIARERGFSDYATWAAWQNHISESLKGSNTAPAQPPQNNWLQGLLNKIPPFSIIGHVSDEYGRATGQKR
jgi:hypothetical protein